MVAWSWAGLANASSREWKESLGSQDELENPGGWESEHWSFQRFPLGCWGGPALLTSAFCSQTPGTSPRLGTNQAGIERTGADPTG